MGCGFKNQHLKRICQKENTKNLPHRSRFYQALIDSKLLDPGEVDFSNMKDCYSIIIAPFDLFGRGLYQYTFQMTCAETGQPLEDGATRIFLNTHGKNSEDISPELKELLYYMEHIFYRYNTFQVMCLS